MNSTQTIFVYGTLKRGDCRHHLLMKQHFLGEATTVPDYLLINLGSYPGLVECGQGDGRSIQGELYQVSHATLQRLDLEEGVAEGLYERRSIRLQNSYQDHFIEAYFYLGQVDGLPEMGTTWPVINSDAK